ncbi:hypothetical protein QCA50_007021 [Cerrena zonata]|uniref:Uncharacterized protein n=1 Tax=Cerrena zonata TaxID=2478898 RepID=A0AAW0GGJ6_9APHY
MPALAAPPALLSDAFSTFATEVNRSLAAVEDHARKQVNQANGNLEAARRERDEAIQELNAIHMREKDWELNVKSSELTIKHQAETIVQLREEAQQWKNQLLRLEETSRREVQDWKEQYLRAEQERTRLSARVDELMSAQILMNQTYAANQADFIDPLPSTSKRSTTRDPSKAILDEPRKSQSRPTKPTTNGASFSQPRTPASNAVASSSKTPKQRHATEPFSSLYQQESVTPARPSSTARPSVVSSRVIRRVQAIVEVPIKEEDDGGNDTAYLSEGVRSVRSASGANTPSKKATPKRKSATTNTNGNGRQSTAATKVRRQSVSSGKGKQPAQYIELDDESSGSDEESGEESEYEPQQGGKQRSGPANLNDEDDDDFLLQSQEQEPSHRAKPTKKRKLDSEAGGTTRGTAKSRKKN